MLLLIENHNYTVPQLCERIGISRRNLYYYLEFFRGAGFLVEHNQPYYRIRKDSPFFRKIDAAVHFTEDEAILMRRLLEQSGDTSVQVERLLQKLNKLYDLDIVDSIESREQAGRNVNDLYEAIKSRRCVVLKGYQSANSDTQRDRLVEPFALINGNQDVRCYELTTHQNKTFKVARIGEVELMDLLWSHESEHHSMQTDVFMFSADTTIPVSLRLGRLATSLLREEYPKAERYIEPDGMGHWRLDMPVCSLLGIGRFILGLYDDIEVLGGVELKQYISQKINHLRFVSSETSIP